MGGDSCASNSTRRVEVWHPKVFLKPVAVGDGQYENVLFGACGAFRLMQLLEYGLEVPPLTPNRSVMEWLVMDVTDKVRHIFRTKGFSRITNSQETMTGDFLIGFRGMLYHMEDSFQIIATNENFMAAGSGASYALGSLEETYRSKPEDRINRALRAAAKYSPSTAAPFTLLKI